MPSVVSLCSSSASAVLSQQSRGIEYSAFASMGPELYLFVLIPKGGLRSSVGRRLRSHFIPTQGIGKLGWRDHEMVIRTRGNNNCADDDRSENRCDHRQASLLPKISSRFYGRDGGLNG